MRSLHAARIAITASCSACVYAGAALPEGGGQAASADAGMGGGSSPAPSGDAGAPTGQWRSVTANLPDDVGDSCALHALAVKPDEDRILIGVETAGLWASDDGGDSWFQLGGGPGSDTITNRATSILFDPDDTDRFWETGIHGGVGVFWTTDGGSTFKSSGVVLSMDLVSVDFTDPERKTIVVGGHEEPQKALRSDDGGETWVDIGKGLPSDASCTYPLVIDATTFLMGCSYTGTGIYRTTDAGNTWDMVSSSGGVSKPLRHSDGSLYWVTDMGRGMVRSTDDGQTWVEASTIGLRSYSPYELADGRIVALGQDAVLVSADRGQSWQQASSPLPFSNISGWTYSPHRNAFFVKQFSCAAGAGVARYDFE